MRRNIVQLGKTEMTIWYMRAECRITKATDKHSEYVIIIAFKLQQWLHQCASMLHYAFIACLVFLITEYSAVVIQYFSLTAYLIFSSNNNPSSTKHLKPVVHFNNIIKLTQ